MTFADHRRRVLVQALLVHPDHRRLYLTNPFFHHTIERLVEGLPDLVDQLVLKSRESQRIAREFEASMDEVRRIVEMNPEELERDRERFLRLLEEDDGKEIR